VAEPPRIASPWMNAKEAAAYMRIGLKTLYALAKSGQLRCAKISNRRDLRFLQSWCDDALIATSTPVEVRRTGTGR
jgi:excisionase family DNA binding protein